MTPQLREISSLFWLLSFILILSGCANTEKDKENTLEKGPHNGRLLTKDELQVELVIFESSGPPEFHAYLSADGLPIEPKDAKLLVTLKRLGGIEDKINFSPNGKYLKGDLEVYEPHSFQVEVKAVFRGKNYEWKYDSFEGRTTIAKDIASSMGIRAEVAKNEKLTESIKAYGKVIASPSGKIEIKARFDGIIKKLHVSLGDEVKKGDLLYTIESNASLNNYSIHAPISGRVSEIRAGVGSITTDTLMVLIDKNHLQIELDIFPKNRPKIRENQRITAKTSGSNEIFEGRIVFIATSSRSNQSTPVRIKLSNSSTLQPGAFVTAEIEVAEFEVPIAVKRTALQSFRDHTVVYEKVDDTYEVRMLELGRHSSEWVEVLGGIAKGAHYVTENSFLIKADIEKSGASHDH